MSFIENVMGEINRLSAEPFIAPKHCCHSPIIKFTTNKEIAWFLRFATNIEAYSCGYCGFNKNKLVIISCDEIGTLSKEFVDDLKKSAIAYMKMLSDAPWKECNNKDRKFFLKAISFENYESILSCDFQNPKGILLILESIAKIRNINIFIKQGFEDHLKNDFNKKRIYICGTNVNTVTFIEALRSESSESSEFSKIKNARNAIAPIDWNS